MLNLTMPNNMYITVTLDVVPEGFNLSMWLSPEDFWISEKAQFPFVHFYWGNDCKWTLHCNTELTGKMVATIAEQAEQICKATIERNNRRKIANR